VNAKAPPAPASADNTIARTTTGPATPSPPGRSDAVSWVPGGEASVDGAEVVELAGLASVDAVVTGTVVCGGATVEGTGGGG
jgi:hypothetical protein